MLQFKQSGKPATDFVILDVFMASSKTIGIPTSFLMFYKVVTLSGHAKYFTFLQVSVHCLTFCAQLQYNIRYNISVKSWTTPTPPTHPPPLPIAGLLLVFGTCPHVAGGVKVRDNSQPQAARWFDWCKMGKVKRGDKFCYCTVCLFGWVGGWYPLSTDSPRDLTI